MNACTYPASSVAADLLRAFAGAAVCLYPVAFLDLNPWFAGALVLVGALFGYFGLLTVARSRTRIVFDDEAVAVIAPRVRRIEWSRLDGIHLNYYRTGSRREQGWMQLTLRGGGQKIRVDSRLAGFRELVQRAHAAARKNGIQLNEATAANERSLREGPI